MQQKLAAEQINALDAIEYLRTRNNVDIIFLDINMPNLSGLQLLKIVQPNQPIIFTTAYAEHAVESYELDAVDYLLKPFSFERFTKAVYKAVDAINNTHKQTAGVASEQRLTVFIKSDGKNYPVFIDDIMYCEARRNYTMVVLKNGRRLMQLMPLTKFETQLTGSGGEFIQVHRSFLICTKYITAITSNHVIVDKIHIPVGIQYKENFLKKIGMRNNLN
jgi:DNA-binding LytR/AlgR family response regulator